MLPKGFEDGIIDQETASNIRTGSYDKCRLVTRKGKSPDLPDRLRDPLVPGWQLANFSAVHAGTRRVYPADYTVANRASAADLEVPYGCVV